MTTTPPNYGSVESEAQHLDQRLDHTWLDEVRRARREAKSHHELFRKTTSSIYYAVGFLPMTLVAFIIPLSMIVVGGVYYNDCPVDPAIPMWLIVAGAVAAGMKATIILHRMFTQCTVPDHDSETHGGYWFRAYLIFMAIFSVVWLIVGSVWVYSEYPPNTTDPKHPGYCQPGLYYYSFSILTIAYIFILLCCFCCIGICVSTKPEKKEAADPEN